MGRVFKFLHFFLYFPLVVCAGIVQPRVHVISPGFFSWSDAPSLSHFEPALDTGLDAVRQRYSYINWTRELLYPASFRDCFSLRDNIHFELAKWYYKRPYGKDVLTVIIAPGCWESRFLSHLATGWDILLITSKDYTENIADRAIFPSFVTTSPFTPAPQIIECALFKKLNWTRTFLLYDTSSAAYEFYSLLLLSRMPALCGVLITRHEFTSTSVNVSQQLQPILRDWTLRSRVMLYAGMPLGLRKILIEATKLNMTFGEHVFVAQAPFGGTSGDPFTWQKNDSDDQELAIRPEFLRPNNQVTIQPVFLRLSSLKLFANAEDQTCLSTSFVPKLLKIFTVLEIFPVIIEQMVRSAYRAVILIAVSDETGPEYNTPAIQRLISKWQALTQDKYNITASRSEVMLNMLVSSHTAVELMAEPYFASFANPSDDRFLWERVPNSTWFDRDALPPNEPPCGFDGRSRACSGAGSGGIDLALGLSISLAVGLATVTGTVLWYGLVRAGIVQPRVHVISPGFFSWSDAPSLSHFEPALETGLDAVRQKYPHINWTREILYRASFSDCFSLRDNIQPELAKWYHTKPYGEDVLTVIVAPACMESRFMSQLATGWDTLLITSNDYTENIADRAIFPSFVTTSPFTPAPQIIQCALFTKLNWTRTFLLYDTSSALYQFYSLLLPLRMPALCGVLLTRHEFTSTSVNVSQQLQPILRDWTLRSRGV
ncbi:hypothetical protein BV898_14708 [Hypsibius exemplaris]|uniref:Receptor ligand binding region domain-containing protein n=1 Tax=Hypsibius exemplaris TaxID=2072580 RepID=A0A9X6NCN5_HYPEX|nr:hypothetical protein BV898_14708 [Hypsibius exemplaris]